MALLDKQQAKDILKTAKEKTADLIGDEGKELLTKAGKFVSDTGSKVTRKTADVIEKTEVREKATKAAEMLSVNAYTPGIMVDAGTHSRRPVEEYICNQGQ